LGEKTIKGVPIVDLEEVLIDLLVKDFGAQPSR
jgi:hypothetical protein